MYRLAYAEIRLILARLLFNFDMELCDESKDWLNQKTYLVWQKPALMVRLRNREGAKTV
jgi:cytochrome P450